MHRNLVLVLLSLLILGGVLLSRGNRRSPSPSQQQSRTTARAAQARIDSSTVLLDSVAQTLNHLASEVVLDLAPPAKVLDDKSSANGREVLATITHNPRDPEGGFNYLSVPLGNGNFRGVNVAPGDIVRFFAKFDQESLEHGGAGQADYYEFPVRRLDTSNPQNALILDVALNGPVEEPFRIEIWRFSDRRMNEIRLRLNRYVRSRRPAVAWEPTPDESALIQLVDRANQWFRNRSREKQPWSLSPIVDTLPAELRQAESLSQRLSPGDLDQGLFDLAELREVQGAIWLRDISAWAKQDAYEPLEVAGALFDWTIRNIQLDPADQPGIVHQPWQALLYGHGTAAHRAWIFVELCRQQQLDVVLLTLDTAGEGTTAGPALLAALLHDGELYLFDPWLGLPLAGRKAGEIATFSQFLADPELLRQQDLDADHLYPVTGEQLRSARICLVATALQLSHRAAALQAALQGEDFVIMSAEADLLSESVHQLQATKETPALWPFPFRDRLAEESLRRPQREQAAQRILVFSHVPRLWKARVLHFQGTKAVPVSQQGDPLAQPRWGHRDATQLYQSPEVRAPDRLLDGLDATRQFIFRTAKSDASYWLGLLSYDLERYEVAEDWLRRRTLEGNPSSPWMWGASYNLAQTLTQLGRLEDAVNLLEADDSPQQQGNRLRARLLQDTAAGETPADE